MDYNQNPQNFESPQAPQVLPPAPPPGPQVPPSATPAGPQMMPPAGPPPQPVQPYAPPSKPHTPVVFYAAIILSMLIAIAGGVYFWHQGQNNKRNQGASSGSGSLLSGLGFYAGEQEKARDSKRMADLKSIQTQLEAFFSQNGYYPSLTDMNNSSWISSNMQTLDTNSLYDPSSASNSFKLASTPTKGQYSYQPTDSSGESCESNDQNCAKYTLTAELEMPVNGSNKYVVKNLD
jgi:Tfp pilus assembly protein PilE